MVGLLGSECIINAGAWFLGPNLELSVHIWHGFCSLQVPNCVFRIDGQSKRLGSSSGNNPDDLLNK